MVSAQHIGKKSKKLTASRIKAYKALARRIDVQEEAAIKSRGRTILKRHGMAREIVRQLRLRRMEKGLSLTELALRTGIAKPNLSRLENNELVSPTLETLHRYAQALGMKVKVELN